MGISYAAKKAGALLKISITCQAQFQNASQYHTIGILQDSIAAAVDWQMAIGSTGFVDRITCDFYVVTSDALFHTYKFASFPSPTNQILTQISRFSMLIEEFA